MGPLKRTYQVGYQPPSKRRRTQSYKLTKALALRKPEVKDVVLVRTIAQVANGTISTAGIFSNIAQGPSGSNRVGDSIRVLSIDICGRVYGETALDATFAVIRPLDASRAPLVDDFSSAIGGQYDVSRGWVLHHSFRDVQTNNVLYKPVRISFPLGMIVKYQPPTETEQPLPIKNEVYVCNVNRTGANATNISYSIRIRYVDV